MAEKRETLTSFFGQFFCYNQSVELPKLFKTRLTYKEMLNKRDLLVEYELIDPSEINFIPGQFVNLNVGENTFRSYSIASDYKTKASMQFVVSIDHEGIGANYLKTAIIGDETKLIGPSGRFMLPQNLLPNLVFVATGTGLAPFIPMFHFLVDHNYQGNVFLYFGVRDEGELFFVDKLDEFKKSFAHFDYKLCLSQPSPTWNQKPGRVTEQFDLSKVADTQFFLCGHPLMIENMIGLLQFKAVATTNIYHEKFTVSIKP